MPRHNVVIAGLSRLPLALSKDCVIVFKYVVESRYFG